VGDAPANGAGIMSAELRLQQAARAARRRRAAIIAAFGVAPTVAAAAGAWRFGGEGAAVGAAALLAVGLALLAWHSTRRIDARWLARRLDRRADMEDSADLLFADPARLTGLQALQRERLRERLATGAAADLREAWPLHRLLSTAGVALLLAAALLFLPARTVTTAESGPPSTTAQHPVSTELSLVSTRLDIAPPAYTGLPARGGSELDGKAPEGSRLSWRLRFSPQPPAVSLRLHDGRRIELRREGDEWTGEHLLARSALYRIVPEGELPLRDARPHRLDAIADQPPQLRVLAPERNLTLRAEGQREWSLSAEASDDHGLGAARLRITLAQGSGEQVTVSERVLALRGEGDPKQRRYTHRLGLAALGLAQGDDLIVRLEVDDNRAPKPQTRRSASYILRWPMPPATEATGMEGLVKRALPAYFRSQRQIILDAEALVAERPRLGADDFLGRSDGIGVDQRILRMRYGQFLGEENVGGEDAPAGEAGDADEEHHAGDGHDHGSEPPADFGGPVNVLEDYGHTHDDAEAATLLDPETRALLKQALDAMWSSEGELRQGQPERALPHAYRALGFIKQVQQASRIYLARVGLELPPIDESRRMTGKREGLGDRRDGLVAATAPDSAALALWRALTPEAGTPSEGATVALENFTAWLRENENTLADPLDLIAALEAVRADPACADCRARLRGRLWPLLPRPAAAVLPRNAPDRAGQAYLDALAPEETR
jgi:hypothetical protein